MSGVSLHLLGPPLLARDGKSVGQLRRKAIALLAYLTVDPQPHSRDALATLLWPECGQSRARANLRRCLFALNEAAGNSLLVADQDTLRLDPRALATDIDAFRRLTRGCGKHDQGQVCEECLVLFKEAESLYQNDFLFGFTLRDSVYFDEWQLLQGERLRNELADLLRTLVKAHETRGLLSEALVYARRLLALDPLEESSHRLVIRLYGMSGRRAAAYRQYEDCRHILKSELGEEPHIQTDRLVAAIREGKLTPRPQLSATAAAAAVPTAAGSAGTQAADAEIVAAVAREVAIIAAQVPGRSERKSIEAAVKAEVGEPFGNDDEMILRARVPTASAAVKAALDAQLACGQKLRIAIHVGAVRQQGSDCTGLAVSHADALLAVVSPGEIILSAPASSRAREAPPRGVTLRSLGLHRLSDLGAPEELYQVLHPKHIRGFPKLPTLDTRPNNLPSQQGSLIGRGKELRELISVLGHDDARLLTLTGPAGTGKTRLALHAAARLIDRFEHGVFFVDLARIDDPSEVLPAISATLQVREPPGQVSLVDQTLGDFLRGRRLLLLLDNFEHLLPAAISVTRLLVGAPGLTLVATSRQRLAVPEEREFRVPPLGLPDLGMRDPPPLESESERLFLSRALEARPDLALTAETVRAISRICLELDGLPLAIELAAARLRLLAPADLERMLPRRLGILKRKEADLPERQQTLERAIEWSYTLLSKEEQRLLERLSAFVAGFSLEAAESTCVRALDGEASIDVLDGISSLVEKSLLQASVNGVESRFTMLQTIRAFALTKLETGSREVEVRESHAAYYLHLAEEAEANLHGPNQMTWLDRLEGDHDNLRQALQWYLERGRFYEAARLCTALEWFWYRYEHFSDAKRWLSEVVGPQGSTAGSSIAGDLETRRIFGRALRALGWFLLVQGDWVAARERYSEGLAVSRESHDKRNEVLALSGLGTVERWLGETRAGTEHTEAAVQMARELRDPLLIALSLIWAYSTTGGKFGGDPPIAELQEALELAHRLGDLWCAAHAYNGLGDLFAEAGDYRSARVHYEKALKGFQELKDGWLAAWTFEGLGRVCLLAGDGTGACENTRESVRLFNELGDRTNVVLMLGRLGLALRLSGRHAHAARILGAFASLEQEVSSVPDRESPSGEIADTCTNYRRSEPQAWSEGETMSYEQALRCALEEAQTAP